MRDLLHAHHRPASTAAAKPRVLLAGATGALGYEVLRLLAGTSDHGGVQVLVREPVRPGLARVEPVCMDAGDPAAWPLVAAEVGVVLFEPARLFYQRERALWVPTPAQLPALARWMHACGVKTLAVALPHDPGRRPVALQHGLTSLDEQSVSALGFERVLWLRCAQAGAGAKAPSRPAGAFSRLLHACQRLVLSVPGYMLPQSQRPVRAAHVAALLAQALRQAPPGVHVASAERLWQVAQLGAAQVASQWLGPVPR
ncbi:MAG: hypothetical protein ACT4NV_19505 [Rhodoferax sp.]